MPRSHTTTLTPEALARLLQQADTSASDPEKRKLAVTHALVRIMTDHMHDRELANKIMNPTPNTESPIHQITVDDILNG